MRIDVPVRRARRRRAAPESPARAFPALPAGSYVMSVQRHGAGDGWIMVGVGNDQFAIVTQPIAAFDGGMRLHLPGRCARAAIRGDEGAREQFEAVELRPSRRPAPATSRVARRAVRYDGTVSSSSTIARFPSRPVSGWPANATAVVIQPDDRPRPFAGAAQRAGRQYRDAGIGGRRESSRWSREKSGASTSRGRRRCVQIRSSAGFRPSDVDPNSRDKRLLGVFRPTAVEP